MVLRNTINEGAGSVGLMAELMVLEVFPSIIDSMILWPLWQKLPTDIQKNVRSQTNSSREVFSVFLSLSALEAGNKSCIKQERLMAF